jgi:hypothetical protein
MAFSISDERFAASLTLPVQQHKARIALFAVSGNTGSGFTATSLGDLPFLGDPVLTSDGVASVRRTMTVDTPVERLTAVASSTFAQMQYVAQNAAMFPADPDGIKGALTASVYANVYWSQRVHDGSWIEIQLAQLQVTGVTYSMSKEIATLTMADWTAALDEAPLVATYAPVSGATPLGVSDAVYDLVSGAFPTGFVGANNAAGGIVSAYTLTYATPTKAGTSFTGSRMDAINTLLKPISRALINGRTGEFLLDLDSFVISTMVWSTTLAGAAVEEYESNFNTDSGYNAVSISWSSADGESFGQVFLVDNDPTSPTYWNGPYGHRIRPDEKVDSVTSGTDALTVATSTLAQVRGFARTVSMKHRPNPLLDPNDQIEVSYVYRMDPSKTVSEQHVIDSIDLPLTSGNMALSTRVISRTVA